MLGFLICCSIRTMEPQPLLRFILIIPLIILSLGIPRSAKAIQPLIFPVLGPVSFTNDYNFPRANGTTHQATDIFASKGRPIVSPVDGTVVYVAFPQQSWGYSLNILDNEGYLYRFIHLNNDTPGTDDGNGGPMHAYAPDMEPGNPVAKGQLIGYVGDSGNAENTPPHLHLDIFDPTDTRINPYDSLVQAQRISSPVLYPQLPNEIIPYGQRFKGGLNVAMGNFDGDEDSEIVTGAGAGGGSHVALFDSDGTSLGLDFFAYNPFFNGGVDVAAGDIDGDGIDEIITAAGAGGGPHIKIYKVSGEIVGSFFAYDPRFGGGVKVGSGDVDGDGVDEIVTGAGAGGGPHVRIFKASGLVVGSFFAYASAFTGGVDVSAGDVVGTPEAEIITSAGPGGGPHIKVLSGIGEVLNSFFAYDKSFHGGVRVSVDNVDLSTPKAEILTAAASFGGPHIRMLDNTGAVVDEKNFIENWWSGFYDIGAGNGTSKAATGVNRRASVRDGFIN